MTQVNEFLIKWADGTESVHRSSEHSTVDDVANSVFGKPTAAEVEASSGHVITSAAQAPAPVVAAAEENAPEEN